MAELSKRPGAPHQLFGRRHQGHRACEATDATLANGEALIVVVIAKAGLAAPYGKRGASPGLRFRHQSDVKVSIGNKAVRVFPVLSIESFEHRVSGIAAGDGWKCGVENGIIDDLVASAVVLVPASRALTRSTEPALRAG
jgi:hypothetical protein